LHRHLVLVLTAALSAAALVPTAAHAGTVSATSHHVAAYRGSAYNRVDITATAAPGERNTITLRRTPDAKVEVADATAPLTAGAGCTATATGVICGTGIASAQFSATVTLGDGDDTLNASDVSTLTADGGEGNDT
jgi:hypothetical protein